MIRKFYYIYVLSIILSLLEAFYLSGLFFIMRTATINLFGLAFEASINVDLFGLFILLVMKF
jgi:hypothetical protein